ncbi:MAG TPA: hypothetical protein VGH94_05925 [Acidimicrobiales bacterium]
MTGDPVVGEKSPLEAAADLLVYIPVGLAVATRDLLPGLAERGRAEVASQVSLARMVGQMVVGQGKDEVGRAMGGARQQVGSLVDQLIRTVIGADDDGPVAAPTPPSAPVAPSPPVARVRPTVATPTAPVARIAESRLSRAPAKKAPAAKKAAPSARTPPVAPTAASLAVPDYDSLAASQVIARLAALAPAELEAVRHYEEATRGRRTILGRIAQLQG